MAFNMYLMDELILHIYLVFIFSEYYHESYIYIIRILKISYKKARRIQNVSFKEELVEYQ